MDSQRTGLSLEQALSILKRRAQWIAVCIVAATVAAFVFSKQEPKRYTATTSLVFNNSQLGQQAAGLQPVDLNNPQAQQSTNVKLVQLGDMSEKTAQALGRALSSQEVKQAISVSAQGESNIVDVSATAGSPKLAAEIANTYTSQFVAEQQNSNHEYYASALALVNKQLAALGPRQRLSPAGVALENRAQSLGVLAELRSGNVQIAQSAGVPTAPSSPRAKRNTILGALFGLLLGLGIAFVIERLDRRLREPADLEPIYEIPLLGVIPERTALARSPGRGSVSSNGLPDGESEAFHLIRAHMRYFNVDRQLRTLLIASAAPGDGKTTVARHLATATAMMGSRVLLMEVDLRRPTIARQLGVRSRPGLSDVLIGAGTVGRVTQSIDLDPPTSHRAHKRTLDVIVAGTAPPNPAALIESHAMEGVLEEVKSKYDLVVIDTPPLTAVSDAFPLLSKVDGVVIVGWVGRNRRDVAERLHETLVGAGAPLLGVIANGFTSRGLGAYGYDYAYTQNEAPAAPFPTDGVRWPAGIGSPSAEESNGTASPNNGTSKARKPTSTAKRTPRKPASTTKR